MNKSFVILFIFSLLIVTHVNCEFTKEEQNALNQVRNRNDYITGFSNYRGMVKNIVYEDYMLYDDYLMSWLRARKLNLDRAKTMLEKNLKWRKEKNIDNIINENTSGVDKCMKVYHGGVDREGRPINYLKLGSWDIRKCVLAGLLQAMNRYVIKHLFEGPARVARSLRHPTTGANVTQFIFVIDLTGFNLRQGACVACLPLFGHAAFNVESYYPAGTFKFLCINTPQVFNVVLDFTRPILNPSTNNAITLFGHNKDEWTKGLDKYISKDQLPVMFGGQRVETQADRALYSTN